MGLLLNLPESSISDRESPDKSGKSTKNSFREGVQKKPLKFEWLFCLSG
jgi:hypothetical protein